MTPTDDEKFLSECEAWVREAKSTIQPEKWWDKIDRLIAMVRSLQNENAQLGADKLNLEAACRVLEEGLKRDVISTCLLFRWHLKQKLAVDLELMIQRFQTIEVKALAALKRAKEILDGSLEKEKE